MNDTQMFPIIEGVKNGLLVKGTLSSPSSVEMIAKIAIRPLMIKSRLVYQLTEYQAQKVTHRNLTPDACAVFMETAFAHYRQGDIWMSDGHYHILVSKHHKMTVVKKANKAEAAPLSHNRPKNYVLSEGILVPFLVALGIMTAEGKVVAKKYDKFRQINRFLEMVRDIVEHLPQGRCLEIVDFGCGKAYLTFALYYYLRDIEKRAVHIVGIDLKQEVIDSCRTLANQLQLDGLTFVVGDIHDFESEKNIDLMISLHACDTATDAALEKAVRWNAGVILCVPCCQHELYSQIKSPVLDTLLRHGILKERLAALVTDAARADLLTLRGYEVQILEFIDMEHTPKNLLLRAIKKVSEKKKQQAQERYYRFKEGLSIYPCLEKRLDE